MRVYFYSEKHISVFLDFFYDTPSDSHIIQGVMTDQDVELVGNLNGQMKYGEIVSVVGDLPEPEYIFDPMVGEWEYLLGFEYYGYRVGFVWFTDPNTTYSTQVSVFRIQNS